MDICIRINSLSVTVKIIFIMHFQRRVHALVQSIDDIIMVTYTMWLKVLYAR